MREFIDADGVSHKLRLTLPIIDTLAGAEVDPVDLLSLASEESTIGNRLMTDPRFVIRLAVAMGAAETIVIDADTTNKLYEAVTAEIVGFFPSRAAQKMIQNVLLFEQSMTSDVTITNSQEASHVTHTSTL